MTPFDLRAKARELDAAGEAALDAGDARAAAVAWHQANVARLAADELERLNVVVAKPLLTEVSSGTVSRPMLTTEHRVAISQGKSHPDNPLVAAARAKKLSLRDVAKRVGVSSGLMTLAFKGDRAMPAVAAKKIEQLIGFPASSWPRLS